MDKSGIKILDIFEGRGCLLQEKKGACTKWRLLVIKNVADKKSVWGWNQLKR